MASCRWRHQGQHLCQSDNSLKSLSWGVCTRPPAESVPPLAWSLLYFLPTAVHCPPTTAIRRRIHTLYPFPVHAHRLFTTSTTTRSSTTRFTTQWPVSTDHASAILSQTPAHDCFTQPSHPNCDPHFGALEFFANPNQLRSLPVAPTLTQLGVGVRPARRHCLARRAATLGALLPRLGQSGLDPARRDGAARHARAAQLLPHQPRGQSAQQVGIPKTTCYGRPAGGCFHIQPYAGPAQGRGGAKWAYA